MFDYQKLAQAGNLLSGLGNLGNMATMGMPTLHSKREILEVHSLQEARDFHLERGEQVALIDNENNILYVKDCDESGKYNLQIFSCKEITEDYMRQNTLATITRADFDKMTKDLADVRALLLSKGEKSNDVQQA